MKRIFHPYNLWEEVKYGMYDNDFTGLDKDVLIDKAVNLLSSPETLRHYMLRTTEEWPYSSEQNMTAGGRNKQAWLGQAACCLFASVPEDYTKLAWSLLTDEQRTEANKVADEVFAIWKDQHAKNI
jgi:hypothetical protein